MKATRAPHVGLDSRVRSDRSSRRSHAPRRARHCRWGRASPHGGRREQLAEHLVGRPADRGDRRDAQPLVDLGAAGVVDAGHDVLDAERLAGDPRGDDVRVVAAADRGEGVGLLDACLEQRVAVEPNASDGLAAEVELPAGGTRRGSGRSPRPRAPLIELVSQCGPDAAAAHDHDVHVRNGSGPVRIRAGWSAGAPAVLSLTARVLSAPVASLTSIFKRALVGRPLPAPS